MRRIGAVRKKMLALARLCGKEYTIMRILRTILALACLSSFAFAGDDEPVLVKLNNGRAEVYTVSGSYVRTQGSGDVVQASTNGREVALLRQNGRVELYSRSGSYMRTLGSGDVTAVQLSGDTVALTKSNGRVEVYGIDGSYKRTL